MGMVGTRFLSEVDRSVLTELIGGQKSLTIPTLLCAMSVGNARTPVTTDAYLVIYLRPNVFCSGDSWRG